MVREAHQFVHSVLWHGLIELNIAGNTAHTELQHRVDPDNKVHVANMGPTWVMAAPGEPHVGPMNLAIRGVYTRWHEDDMP